MLFYETPAIKNLTLLEQHWYCCNRKARAASAQSFTLWQQATI